jgi:hypothetical protein
MVEKFEKKFLGTCWVNKLNGCYGLLSRPSQLLCPSAHPDKRKMLSHTRDSNSGRPRGYRIFIHCSIDVIVSHEDVLMRLSQLRPCGEKSANRYNFSAKKDRHSQIDKSYFKKIKGGCFPDFLPEF